MREADTILESIRAGGYTVARNKVTTFGNTIYRLAAWKTEDGGASPYFDGTGEVYRSEGTDERQAAQSLARAIGVSPAKGGPDGAGVLGVDETKR